jgi:hypothetical protein
MREKTVYSTNPDGNIFGILPKTRRSLPISHMVNQPILKSFNTAPKYKYGYEIPRTYEQAKRLDQKNGKIPYGEMQRHWN